LKYPRVSEAELRVFETSSRVSRPYLRVFQDKTRVATPNSRKPKIFSRVLAAELRVLAAKLRVCRRETRNIVIVSVETPSLSSCLTI
jgi:hypothetical protein